MISLKKVLSSTKHILFFILFFTFFLNNTQQICNIPIVIHANTNQAQGYDNCNSKTNGEYNVINYFIKPNQTVFDIGANKGEWSNYALSKYRSIILYAFEPIPTMYNQLTKNIISQNAKTYMLAISNSNATKIFYQYQDISQSSFFRRNPEVEKNIGSPQKISVVAKTIDSFCNEYNVNHIGFLKIDTEGGEADVLTGAHRLLENQAIDTIQFEYGGTYKDAKISLEKVYYFLTNFGYNIYRIAPSYLIFIDKWDKTLENYRYSNYLAISNNFIKRN